MLYESVRQSAAFFKKRKKAIQTLEEKLSFRWKFLVLGLGVILVILIGICSQLIRSITQQKSIPIDTTFVHGLISQSKFFTGDITPIRQLIKALQATEDVKFNNAKLLFAANQASGKTISRFISGHQDLLIFMKIVDPLNNTIHHNFGLYLKAQLPRVNYSSQSNLFIPDSRGTISNNIDSQYSMLYSLQSANFMKLDLIDACYIYSYQPSNKNLLSFVELLHFSDDAISSTVFVEVVNYGCFTRNIKEKDKAIQTIKLITGLHLDQNQTQLTTRLEWMEVFQLNNDGVNKISVKQPQFQV